MAVTVTTSAVDRFLNALVDRLRLREGLEKVAISSGPLGPDEAGPSIEFIDWTAPQDWGALGNRRREEEATFRGFIWYQKRVPVTEDGWRELRGRATAILAEIEDELRATPEGVQVFDASGVATCRTAHVTENEGDQGVNANGRWVSISFAIEVKATLPTS